MGMAIKKGDKFRVNKDDCCGGFRNGDVFVAVRDGECDVTFYDNEGDLRLINREQVTFVDDFGDPWDYKPALKIEAGKSYRGKSGTIYNVLDNSENSAWLLCSDHEPFKTRHFWRKDGTAWERYSDGVADDLVEELAGLRIQEDKYYRTRDGRKVGPMRNTGQKDGDRWKGEYDEGTSFWHDDGSHWKFEEKPTDLIAEWTESKTKGCSAAEVDNLRDEYGPVVGATAAPEPKFKAGDRVVFVTDSPAYGASHTDGFLVVRSVFPDGDVKCSYPGRGYDYTQVIHHDDLELAPEPDTTLSVNITSDTSELDAEIDRIKRKLKKLSKKARKIGISLDYDLAA